MNTVEVNSRLDYRYMANKWDEARLQQYIDDEIQENLELDYKRGVLLSKKMKKEKRNWLEELTKDISAMANSAGGVIIYGIAETNHMPTEFDPVDISDFSPETLDQIINANVRPRIDNLQIHTVKLKSGENDFAYVIEVPQSNTAHQASDKRYHKRFNATTEWMEDYEVRDVMGRRQHPEISLNFLLEVVTNISYEYPTVPTDGRRKNYLTSTNFLGHGYEKPEKDYTKDPERKVSKSIKLVITVHNTGNMYAQYINANVEIPDEVADLDHMAKVSAQYDGTYSNDENDYLNKYFSFDNTGRDFLEYKSHGTGMGGSDIYGPKRYEPLLPDQKLYWELYLSNNFDVANHADLEIYWSLYCDNRPAQHSSIKISEIEMIEETLEDPEPK